MGDIFYPDNPKRRARAEELYNQIKIYEQEFKTLKAERYHPCHSWLLPAETQ